MLYDTGKPGITQPPTGAGGRNVVRHKGLRRSSVNRSPNFDPGRPPGDPIHH